MSFFSLQSELYQANKTSLGKDQIVCLASFDSIETFVIKDEIEYRKLLKVAKETNNSIKFWFDYLPYESNKLININKKYDDLFLKSKQQTLPKQSDTNSNESETNTKSNPNLIASTKDLPSVLNNSISTFKTQSVKPKKIPLSFSPAKVDHSINFPNIYPTIPTIQSNPMSLSGLPPPIPKRVQFMDKPNFNAIYQDLYNRTTVLDSELLSLNNQIEKVENKLINEDDSSDEKENVNPNKLLKHPNIFCDCCDVDIVGIRFKCIECADFDLCEKCEKIENVHITGHNFIKIVFPIKITNLSVPTRAKRTYDWRVHVQPPKFKQKQSPNQKKDNDSLESKTPPVKVAIVMDDDQENATHLKSNKKIEKKTELSNDEEVYNKVKEMHDKLLGVIEPSFRKRSAYYVESFKTLSMMLLKNSQEEDESINCATNSSHTSMKFDKLDKQSDKQLRESILKLTALYQKSSRTEREIFCKNFLDKYIKFVGELSKSEEFLASCISDLLGKRKSGKIQKQRMIIDNINHLFFTKSNSTDYAETVPKAVEKAQIINSQVKGDKLSKQDTEKIESNLKSNDCPLWVYPTNFNQKSYNECFEKIHKNDAIKNKGQAIKDFKLNVMKMVRCQPKENGVTIVDILQKAFEKINSTEQSEELFSEQQACALKQIVLNEEKSDDEKEKTDTIEEKIANEEIEEIVINEEIEEKIVNEEIEEKIVNEEIEKKILIKEIDDNKKDVDQKFYLEISCQVSKPDSDALNSNVTENEPSLSQLTNEKIEPNECKSFNLDTIKSIIEDEDLVTYSDLASCSSISIEKICAPLNDPVIVSIDQVNKQQDIFYNITLDNVASKDSSCSTPKSSIDSSCSLDSFELIMSDSFDFEKNGNEIKATSDFDQKLEKSSIESNIFTTTPTQDQLMNSSRTSIYKSLIESSIKEPTPSISNQKQDDTLKEEKKKKPKIQDAIFDFNNWTYLLDMNAKDLQSNSSKSTQQIMGEFYSICKNEYGLK